MTEHAMDQEEHSHVFLGADHEANARRTWIVIGLTTVMMVLEIAAGHWFGSMALVADGWHMSTHAAALMIAALAYRFARRHAADRRFTFGTGKVGELAGFASSIVLALVALLIGWESALRLQEPVAIDFRQAIAVAGLGLAVNLVCAWISAVTRTITTMIMTRVPIGMTMGIRTGTRGTCIPTATCAVPICMCSRTR